MQTYVEELRERIANKELECERLRELYRKERMLFNLQHTGYEEEHNALTEARIKAATSGDEPKIIAEPLDWDEWQQLVDRVDTALINAEGGEGEHE